MIVPTLATIVVGTNGLVNHLDTAGDAERARTLADLSSLSGELVHELQEERATAVRMLSADSEEERDERADEYAEIHRRVDDLEERYRAQSAAVEDVPQTFRNLLGDVDGQLSVLDHTRQQIGNEAYGITGAAASYETLISNLLNLRDSTAQFAGDVELANRMQAAAALAQAKELLSQQRVVGLEVLARDAYHPHMRTSFIGARTGREQALQSFGAVATDSEQADLDRTLEGPDVRQSRLYQDYLDSLDGTQVQPPFDADGWDEVMATHADLLHGLENDLDEVIAADASALRDSVIQRVLLETGLLLMMLLLAVLLAWLVARSMARSLRDLRHGALSVAQHGLPRAVQRLRDPTLATSASPGEVAHEIAEPLPVRSRDEFGQVSEAFNVVHLEAVRTAAEQAQLRSSVATMFVNLARRSQIMVDRLINHLDRLERGEEDPDRLGELFQLDHLATRMRRNDENLLVLAGADSTRVQREPASLIDVLRGAQSEVEHYTRIEFGVVERDLMVSAHAVNDLVHLVAELLDNATAFSPPDSPVMVEARRVGDRAVLYVEDQGLGMSADQFDEVNERLANPPMVDVAVSRMMGLVVVGRLAARHGVRVQLRAASERGTIADVTLPASVLLGSDARGSGSRGGDPAARPPTPDATGDWSGGGAAAASPTSTTTPSSPPPAGTGPPSGGSPPPSRDRPTPAWSDLAGMTGFHATDAGPPGANGADPHHSAREHASQNGGPTPSLPQRRPDPTVGEQPDSGVGYRPAGEAPPSTDTAAGQEGYPVPRPRDAGPTSGTSSGSPQPGAPQHGASQSPGGGSPEQAPPSWPPVGPSSSTPVPTQPPAPPPQPDPSGWQQQDTAGWQQQQDTAGWQQHGTGWQQPESTGWQQSQGQPGGYAYGGPQPVGSPAQSSPNPAAPPNPTAPPNPAAPPNHSPAEPAAPPGPPYAAAEQPVAYEQPAAYAAEQPAAEYSTGRPEPQGQFGGAAAAEHSAWSPAAAQAAQAAAAASAQAAQAAAAAQEASSHDTAGGGAPSGDETMELPIFRELESMWFRTRRPVRQTDEPAPAADTGAGDTMEFAAIRTGTSHDGSTSPGAESGTPENATVGDAMRGDIVRDAGSGASETDGVAGQGWETAADEGWRAASQAAEAPVEETTSAGLPKRQPMAQLVPGGVEKSPSAGERRSPEAVRGLLSAYHRGVQRGREQTTGPGAPGGGSQSAQAGKEQST